MIQSDKFYGPPHANPVPEDHQGPFQALRGFCHIEGWLDVEADVEQTIDATFVADKLMAAPPADIDFMELVPENWIHVGGALGKKLRYFTERYPMLMHGLSLSIGSPAPLDEQLVRDIKAFMAEHEGR